MDVADYFTQLESQAGNGRDAVLRFATTHARRVAETFIQNAKVASVDTAWESFLNSNPDQAEAFREIGQGIAILMAKALTGDVAGLLEHELGNAPKYEEGKFVNSEPRKNASGAIAPDFAKAALDVSALLTFQRGHELLSSYAAGRLFWKLLDAGNGVVETEFKGDRQRTLMDLAVAVIAEALKLKLAIERQMPSTEEEALRTVDGMLWADAVFAEHIATLGERKTGPRIANGVRDKARERANRGIADRFVLWVDADLACVTTPPLERLGARWVSLLTTAVWHDVVLPELEREARLKSSVNAVPVHVVRDFLAVAASSRLESDEKRGVLLASRADDIPLETDLLLTTVKTMQRLTLEQAPAVVNSPYFWTVVEWIARTVQRQEIQGLQDPHIIRVENGDDGLRVAVGVTKKDAAPRIRQVLDFLHMLGSASAPGHGRMVTVSRSSIATGGRPRIVTVIEVGLLMRPKKAQELGLPSPWDAPILHVPLLQTVGDHRTKAVQINAQQGLVLYAHERRAQIACEGELELTKRRWNEHTERYGLYHRSHASLRDRLFDAIQTESATPPLPFHRSGTEPLLVRTGPDRYRFGNTFTPEWEHIIEQGNITLGRSHQGQKSAEKRAAGVQRDAAKEKRKRGH